MLQPSLVVFCSNTSGGISLARRWTFGYLELQYWKSKSTVSIEDSEFERAKRSSFIGKLNKFSF